MRVRFSKMHHLGEDFVVIDGLTQHVRLTTDMVRLLTDRRLGVGCQQVLVVESPNDPDMDFRGRLFNRDGTLATNHYHASYCLARFVWERRLTARQQIQVEAVNGLNTTFEGQEDGQVTGNLGVPEKKPETGNTFTPTSHQLDLGDQNCEVTVAGLNQAQAIVTLSSVADAPLRSLGRRIQQHSLMPTTNINVGFMAVLSRNEIDLRIFQDSGSEARACLNTAIGAVMAGRFRGLLDEQVKVKMPGGNVSIQWHGEGSPVLATGLATTVFQGQIHL